MPQNRGISDLTAWTLASDESGDSEIACGGQVIRALAAVTLLIGDAVFISADGTVSKSVTTADFLKSAGLVIGGRAFGRNAIQRANDVGAQCALATQEVY